jgi:hypothetical protein
VRGLPELGKNALPPVLVEVLGLQQLREPGYGGDRCVQVMGDAEQERAPHGVDRSQGLRRRALVRDRRLEQLAGTLGLGHVGEQPQQPFGTHHRAPQLATEAARALTVEHDEQRFPPLDDGVTEHALEPRT